MTHLWAVIWKSYDAPVVRHYLWTVGFQKSAEKALEVAEDKAVGDGEEERRLVATPGPDPHLVAEKPEIKRGVPHWAVLWRSHHTRDVRHLLYREPERTWEDALEVVQVDLQRLGVTNPPIAKTYAHGTFYPVRLDMRIDGRRGQFYPVLVTAAVDVYEDPTVGQMREEMA